MKATYNKSEIMKSAWNMVKSAAKSLSEALKAAWFKAKNKMTKAVEKIIIDGEWRRDNSVVYKAAVYTQNPGEFMKKVQDLAQGTTPALSGDSDADVIAYFSAIYPGKQIVSKVI